MWVFNLKIDFSRIIWYSINMKKITGKDIYDRIRKPTAKPSIIMKSRAEKRIQKFSYKDELTEY
jgi:hypothetical protein